MPQTWLPSPESGIACTAAFDGSENNDWTAIRCESIDGYSFTPRYGPDRRPTIWNPEEWGGRIPRAEVNAAVDEIFATWRIERMYCDPQDWYSEIGAWSLEYGEEHVFEWPTNKIDRMFRAIRRFEIDLPRITHDGCPITAVHMANCRKIAKPGQKYVLGKPADHQKIDAAMASILAHEARADAIAGGWDADPDRMSSKVVVFR